MWAGRSDRAAVECVETAECMQDNNDGAKVAQATQREDVRARTRTDDLPICPVRQTRVSHPESRDFYAILTHLDLSLYEYSPDGYESVTGVTCAELRARPRAPGPTPGSGS